MSDPEDSEEETTKSFLIKRYDIAAKHFFIQLSWRHAMIAGFFVVMYGAVKLAFELYDGGHPSAAGWLLVLASPIGVLFCAMDRRLHHGYTSTINVAATLEESASKQLPGIFLHQRNRVDHWPSASHTSVAQFLFISYSFIAAFVGAYLIWAAGLCTTKSPPRTASSASQCSERKGQ